MSRSRKKRPGGGITTHESEKYDKRKNNRKLRKSCKNAIRKNKELMPKMKEVSDLWGMQKDGHRYYVNSEDKSWYPKLMRK